MCEKLVLAIIVKKLLHLVNHNFPIATINANSIIPSRFCVQFQCWAINFAQNVIYTSL